MLKKIFSGVTLSGTKGLICLKKDVGEPLCGLLSMAAAEGRPYGLCFSEQIGPPDPCCTYLKVLSCNKWKVEIKGSHSERSEESQRSFVSLRMTP